MSIKTVLSELQELRRAQGDNPQLVTVYLTSGTRLSAMSVKAVSEDEVTLELYGPSPDDEAVEDRVTAAQKTGRSLFAGRTLVPIRCIAALTVGD